MTGFQMLFVLFLTVPLVEIWLLIKMGGVIGVGWTIFLVVATALAGAALVRSQGLSTLARIQAELAHGGLPAQEMLEGMLLLIAGAVLLTPGFVTDAVGLALLVPPLRRTVVRWLLQRGFIHAAGVDKRDGDSTHHGSNVINGTSRREDD